MSAGAIGEAVRSLVTVNLGLREEETLLLLADRGEPGQDPALVDEVHRHLSALHPRTRLLVYPGTGRSGIEPPGEAWEAAFGHRTAALLGRDGLLERLRAKTGSGEDLSRATALVGRERGETAQVVVNIAHFSTTHTAFRRLLTECAGARYASMPLFDREMFFGPMAIDWGRLADSTRTLSLALAGADRYEVSAPNGTSLSFSVAGRPVKADDGDLTAPGAFGNLPAGEVFLAPVEGTGEGELVIEWGPTRRLSSPLTVRIEKGRAAEVRCRDSGEAAWFSGLLAGHPDNANLAEIGIGTNPGAKRADNILESEKILGTVHLAFGDNHTFGGRVVAPFHLDFVVFSPTLDAVWERGGGRRLILDRGMPGW
jgi:aminopeptidase